MCRRTNTPESAPQTALSQLADVLKTRDRHRISSALAACRGILHHEVGEHVLLSLAIISAETEGGRVPVAFITLKSTSRNIYCRRIRWERSVQALEALGAITLLNAGDLVDAGSPGPFVRRDDESFDNMEIVLRSPFAVGVDADVWQRGFASNHEYIRTVLGYIDSLHEQVQSLSGQYPQRNAVLDTRYQQLRQTARRTEPLPPLEILCQACSLTDIEWTIIALVLRAEIDESDMDSRTVCDLLCGERLEKFEFRRHFSPQSVLVRSGIITLEETFRWDKVRISMQPDLLQWLIGGGDTPAVIKRRIHHDRPFEDQRDYASAWLEFARQFLVMDDRSRTRAQRVHPRILSGKRPVCDDPSTKHMLEILIAHGEEHPIGHLLRCHNLDMNECVVLGLALLASTLNTTVPVDPVLDILSGHEPLLRIRYESYFSPASPLLRTRLLEVEARDNDEQVFTMPKDLARTLLGVEGDPSGARRASDDMLHVLRVPAHDLSSVILHGDLLQCLETAMISIRPEMIHRMRQWGVERMTATRPPGSLTMLLYGPSGTGKSFLAEGFAGSLDRKLFVVDAERILSKWHGQSEKQLQRVFDAYSHSRNAEGAFPVMLLNECDQLLADRSRLAGSTSVDLTEHRMQNILLENLERFEGILIATTNLRDALDHAFERRFDYKIELPIPDPGARLLLWKAHIPSAIPRSSDVDLATLANDFVITGGRIALIAYNAIRTALLRGDALTQSDLLNACAIELRGSFEATRSRAAIGFRSSASNARTEATIALVP